MNTEKVVTILRYGLVKEALQEAKTALENSKPAINLLAEHYPEPVKRHEDALDKINAALAFLSY